MSGPNHPDSRPGAGGPPTLDMRRNKRFARQLPLPAAGRPGRGGQRLEARRGRLPGVAEMAATEPIPAIPEPIGDDGPTTPAYSRPSSTSSDEGAPKSDTPALGPDGLEADDEATVVDPSVPSGLAQSLLRKKASARQRPGSEPQPPPGPIEPEPLPPPPVLASPPPPVRYPPLPRSQSTISNAAVAVPQSGSERRRRYAVAGFFATMLAAVILSMVFLDAGPAPEGTPDGGVPLGSTDASVIVPVDSGAILSEAGGSPPDADLLEPWPADAGPPEPVRPDAAPSSEIEPRPARARRAKSRPGKPEHKKNGKGNRGKITLSSIYR